MLWILKATLLKWLSGIFRHLRLLAFRKYMITFAHPNGTTFPSGPWTKMAARQIYKSGHISVTFEKNTFFIAHFVKFQVESNFSCGKKNSCKILLRYTMPIIKKNQIITWSTKEGNLNNMYILRKFQTSTKLMGTFFFFEIENDDDWQTKCLPG